MKMKRNCSSKRNDLNVNKPQPLWILMLLMLGINASGLNFFMKLTSQLNMDPLHIIYVSYESPGTYSINKEK